MALAQKRRREIDLFCGVAFGRKKRNTLSGKVDGVDGCAYIHRQRAGFAILLSFMITYARSRGGFHFISRERPLV